MFHETVNFLIGGELDSELQQTICTNSSLVQSAHVTKILLIYWLLLSKRHSRRVQASDLFPIEYRNKNFIYRGPPIVDKSEPLKNVKSWSCIKEM